MRGLYNIAVDNQKLMELALDESKRFDFYYRIKDSWTDADIMEYVDEYLKDSNCYYEKGNWLFYNEDEKIKIINNMFNDIFSDMNTDFCRVYRNAK